MKRFESEGGEHAMSMSNLTPALMRMFRELRGKAMSTLYHYSDNAPRLMNEGVDMRMLQGRGEPWKPRGLYWAERPHDVTLTMAHDPKDFKRYVSDTLTPAGNTFYEPGTFNPFVSQPGIIRGLTSHLEERTKTIDEDVLKSMLRERMRAGGVSGVHEQYPTGNASEEMIQAHRKELLYNLLNAPNDSGYTNDFLRVNNVDGHSGLTELIQLRPDMVKAFWRDRTRALGVLPFAPAAGVVGGTNAPVSKD